LPFWDSQTRFSRKEIDALCQVAYELQEKLTKVLEPAQAMSPKRQSKDE